MASFDQIRDQLMAAGHPKLPDGHPTISKDGKPIRYGPGKKYWYSIHEVVKDGRIAGYIGAFGMWSGDDNGAESFKWQGEPLTEADVAAAKQWQQDAAHREAEQRAKAAKNAASRGRQQWSAAQRLGESAYLAKKHVTPESVRFAADGDLLVPMIRYAIDPLMVGVQKITSDGAKRFNKGMDKIGAACRLGEINPDDKIALLCEGYATGRSIRMATDAALPCYVCFDAGNLLSAARLIRELYPEVHLLFCADDDWQVRQRLVEHMQKEYGVSGVGLFECPVQIVVKGVAHEIQAAYARDTQGIESIELKIAVAGKQLRPKRFENAGLKRAFEAAAELGNASVVFPLFADRGERKLTDFNDLHVEEGLDAVKAQITTAVLSALVPQGDVKPYGRLQLVKSAEDQAHAQAVAKPAKATKSKKSNRATERDVELENEAPAWQANLRRAERSYAILPALDNVFAILANDPRWEGVLGFEEFSNRVMKVKPPPFDGGEVGEWTDRDDARCILWLGQLWGFGTRSDVVMDAVFLVADRNRYHVVRDYLSSLQWDRTPRLRTWCIAHLGAVDTPYTRLAGYKYLMGAVGRVMRPGCKMDNLLILEGAQDAGKSAVFRVLFGAQWFTDANIQIGEKDAFAAMAGKWVIELAELDALSKADSSLSKKFFSTAVDTYRPVYAKRAIDVPRQSVFAGTVNFDTYLKDESGNRRYWPIRVADALNLRQLAADRDQIWAEAYSEYLEWEKANLEADIPLPAPWQVLPAEKPLFELEQYARYEGDEYENLIRGHLLGKKRTTMGEILAEVLKLEISKWTMAEQRRVGKALKSIGWVRKRESTQSRSWYYAEPDPVAIAVPFAAPADFKPEDDDAPL